MVNILSMSAHGGQPFITAYCGSKGALETLTKNAAFSLMPWRIRVNGLNIGWMNTPGEDRIIAPIMARRTAGWTRPPRRSPSAAYLIRPRWPGQWRSWRARNPG